MEPSGAEDVDEVESIDTLDEEGMYDEEGHVIEESGAGEGEDVEVFEVEGGGMDVEDVGEGQMVDKGGDGAGSGKGKGKASSRVCRGVLKDSNQQAGLVLTYAPLFPA
jgi:hypothetical protein